jgi:hypothetical protein
VTPYVIIQTVDVAAHVLMRNQKWMMMFTKRNYVFYQIMNRNGDGMVNWLLFLISWRFIHQF